MSLRESLSLGLTDSRTVAVYVVDNTTINGPNYTTSRDLTQKPGPHRVRESRDQPHSARQDVSVCSHRRHAVPSWVLRAVGRRPEHRAAHGSAEETTAWRRRPKVAEARRLMVTVGRLCPRLWRGLPSSRPADLFRAWPPRTTGTVGADRAVDAVVGWGEVAHVS